MQWLLDKKSSLFYVVGGDHVSSKTSELFDLHGSKRSLLPDTKCHRSKIAAVALDGEVYALGNLKWLVSNTNFKFYVVTY